jgi:heptosyltransferase III
VNTPRTIILVHPGGLGDLLLAVPAIRLLRERFPDHQLLLCGHGETVELLTACRLVDRWISAQTTACTGLFSGTPPDDPLLKDWLGRCDVAVAWTSDGNGALAAALRQSGAVEAVVQSPFASTLRSIHQSERFIEIVCSEAGPVSIAPLPLPAELRVQAEGYFLDRRICSKRPVAMVHPGSGSWHKCVKAEILVPVIEALEREGREPIILEGPADHEMVERLLIQIPRPPIVVRDLPLSVLAGLLSQVDLFLGRDSGVTHLAAVLGTPTVALFGPTDPRRWAPKGPAVIVVNEKPCACVSSEMVKSCSDKPCLTFEPATILDACRTARSLALTPRIY